MLDIWPPVKHKEVMLSNEHKKTPPACRRTDHALAQVLNKLICRGNMRSLQFGAAATEAVLGGALVFLADVSLFLCSTKDQRPLSIPACRG